MLRIASRPPSVAYATSPSGRRESFLVGEPLAIPAEFPVSPESPLLGEMSRQRQRGCTKASLTIGGTLLNVLVSFLRRLFLLLSCPSSAHYVAGAPSLPPPLTPEEEKTLLARMMAGDRAARDDLITHNLRLVVYLAKKYENTGVPAEDMISIGTIGLIKAVNTFTPERNIKLATYASRCIGNEILMYLRKSSNRRQEASIDEPLNVDGDGNELLLSDILGSDEDLVSQRLEQNAERATLRQSVALLSPRERQIMELRFGLVDGVERTQKEAADALGISQSYISRLEKRIIRELKKKLEE